MTDIVGMQPNRMPPIAPPRQPWAVAIFDIDGVVRDVSGSYRRAIADTVEQWTAGAYRPSLRDIDRLKAEGCWNNDWKASQELIYRFYEAQGQSRSSLRLDYEQLVGFFQSRYRGENFSGYIRDEPLLLSLTYLQSLTQAGIPWGFFSGATRGSALFVLEHRLGLQGPILVAMEDAPGKPDPQGLLMTLQQLSDRQPQPLAADLPVFYLGDTVADLQTVERAKALVPDRPWIGVGIIPPHIQDTHDYAAQLTAAGATLVLPQVEQFTPDQIRSLLA